MATANTWANKGGYYANDRLSVDWRMAAQPEMKMLQYVKDEPLQGGKGGENVNFPKVYDFDTTYATSSLVENAPIPTLTASENEGTLTVREEGVATDITEKLARLAAYDQDDIALARLRAHMTKTVHYRIMTAFKTTYYKYVATTSASGSDQVQLLLASSKYGNFSTDGSIAGTQNRVLEPMDLRCIKDYMVDVLHVPGYGNGADFEYVFVAPQTTMSALMANDEIRNDLRYSYSSNPTNPLMKGSLGVWNGILFQVVNANLLRYHNTSYTGEALMFGADAVIGRTVVAPEIRRDSDDFGRLDKVAWYGLFGYSATWGTDSTDVTKEQGRIVHVTSAA